MNLPPVVSAEEWQAARGALLVKEKEATRARDALAAARRRLPRVHIEKDYVFDGPAGKATLLDLFASPGGLAYQFVRGEQPRPAQISAAAAASTEESA